MEITSLDLSVLEEELEALEEGFVQQVYQRGDELTLEVYVPGDEKKRLIIGPSYVFLSNYSRDNPERPPGFAMELRKHLGRIDTVEQKGFDRVLEISCGDVSLVCELFGKGNFILLEGKKIIGALRQEEWADRSVFVGEEYTYPEPATDPRGSEMFEILEEGELVRRVASDLSLGGTYAEELCARAGVGKATPISELGREEKERARNAFEEILEDAEDPGPVLYLDGEEPERAAPFELETYGDRDKEYFDLFSRALDEYFYRRQKKEKEEKRQSAYEEKRQGLEKQLEQQQRKIEGLEKSSEENREKAELIYQKYQLLEKVKEAVEKGIKKHGWDETEQRIRNADEELTDRIKSFNEREGFVVVEVEDANIKVEPGEDLEATASRYYDRAKRSEQKMENAEQALEETRRQLKELDEEEVEIEEEMEDQTSKRSKKWFEKYRWFFSSEGFLVIAGRDAQTNEMLVNKHLEEGDLYFHADFDAAPSVGVKDGRDAGDPTIEEAAKAAVSFSSMWKRGIGSGSAYYVEPGQVTKDPESGEYVGKGAFVIRGERDYVRNVSAEVAVGPYEIEQDVYVPMSGPLTAVKENCEFAVELEPGRRKKSDVAKEIRSRFADKGYDIELDYIIRALPPGKSDVKQ